MVPRARHHHGELTDAKKELKEDAVELCLHFKIYFDGDDHDHDQGSALQLFFPLKTKKGKEGKTKIVDTTLRDLFRDYSVEAKIMDPFFDHMKSKLPALKKLKEKNYPIEVAWMSISDSSCKPIAHESFPLLKH
ncbi:expressed unknown protein [Seminavis robusta]|uniref:Uncharacterized protein n=1 Tax=Seminavis robusta TaxID=568900 RepID=A0A9N8DAP9_9STRA|nr:expressed unknown protein [Seminavis robusta]|eukprot:Sro17_g012320.1 n/a (134) ;mRNA; f:79131-79532